MAEEREPQTHPDTDEQQPTVPQVEPDPLLTEFIEKDIEPERTK